MAAIMDSQRLGYYSPVNLLLVRERVRVQEDLADGHYLRARRSRRASA